MALEQFHFTPSDDSEAIVVPYFVDAVKRRDMRRLQKQAKEQGGFENLDDDVLFEAAGFDAAIIERLDDLSMRDFTVFVKQWADTSGDLGKSSAS